MTPRHLPALLIAALCFAFAQTTPAAEYDLFILAGQSNMDGYGLTRQLAPKDQGPVANAVIFHGSPTPDNTPNGAVGLWKPLKPGHGRGFHSNGAANQYSDAFGPELFFAKTLRQHNPNRKIAIVKYSRGGTSIHQDAAGKFGCWEPDFTRGKGLGKGINQYDYFLATIDAALAVRDIDGDGEDDHLHPAGILWMQGESDASYTATIANQYQANLKRLMDLMRAAVRTDDLPVVIGRISDSGQDPDGKVWNHGNIVRKAQADFVKQDGFAALVTTTDNYGYSDKWHYDTNGFIDLGKQFALRLLEIERRLEKATR